jgi:hypothetical protein
MTESIVTVASFAYRKKMIWETPCESFTMSNEYLVGVKGMFEKEIFAK